MRNEKILRIIEIKNKEGQLLATFRIEETKIIEPEDKPASSASIAKKQESKEEKVRNLRSVQQEPETESPMSDAQKRYIFRLLADMGIEGEAAHEHLKELFGVSSLKEVTKAEASQAIEQLLDEQRRAVNA